MSDNYLVVIPVDPWFVPPDSAVAEARARLAALVPQAESVVARVNPQPEFIDAGTNFESIACPICSAEIDMDSWGEAMSLAAESGFADLSMTTPCCGEAASLNDLHYEWPQGFARFVLEAKNPGVDKVQLDEIASVLGQPLRPVWAHY